MNAAVKLLPAGFLVFNLWPLCSRAETVSLHDAFEAAMKVTETVEIQKQNTVQAEEHLKQAKGSMFPQFTGSANYSQQDTSSINDPFFPSHQQYVKVSATQPLFRGFADFAALRQLKMQLKEQHHLDDQQFLTVFNNLITTYFSIMSLEQDIKDIDSEMGFFEERIKELRGFVRIGRSQSVDVTTVQVSEEGLRAQREADVGQINVAREAFHFQTGLDSNSSLKDTSFGPDPLKPMAQYLEAIDLRPDVEAAKSQSAASYEGINIAKGAHWPQIDVSGDYFLNRTGPQQGVDWDFALNLTIPIFEWGIIQSQVRAAASAHYIDELNLHQTKRTADMTIKSSYASVLADRAQATALKKEIEVAKKTYELDKHDYRLGLVNNIDVLTALINYQESVRSYDKAGYQEKLDYLKLEVAAGKVLDNL